VLTLRSASPIALIAGLGALCSFLLALHLGVSTYRGYRGAMDDAARVARNQALALEQHVARTLDSIDGVITSIIAEASHVDLASPEFHLRLKEMSSAGPQFGRIVVTDAEGRLVQSSFDPPSTTVTYADREFFAIHRDNPDPGLHISRPVLGRVAKTWTIPLSRRMSHSDGSFAGVAIAALDPAYFNGFLRSIDLGPNGSLGVFLDDGTVLAMAPGGEEWIATTPTGGSLARLLQKSSIGTFRGAFPTEHIDSVVSYRKLGGLPVVVAVSLATDDALAGWYAFIREAVAIWVGATLVVALFAWLVILTLRRQAVAEARLDAIFNSTFEFISLLDVDGRVIEINQASLDFAKLRRADVVGRPYWEYASRPDDPQGEQRLKEAVAAARNGTFVRYEAEMPGKGQPTIIDASLKPIFDKAGRVVFLVAEGRDITEHRRLFDALKEANERLETIVDASPLAITEVDRDTRVLSWNQAAEKMFGWEASEILGKPLPTVPDELRDNLMAALESTFSGFTLKRIDSRRRRKDGSLIDVSLWTAPHRDASGTIVGCFGILTDITEQKHLEDQSRQAQRLNAIGQLTGGVAHEFNNLLQVILGNLESLGEVIRGQADASERLERIMRAVRRGGELTQQLLAFSRKQPLRPEVFHPKGELQSLEYLVRATVGAQYQIAVDVAPEASYVCADASQLANALLNLVLNSRDAMPAGGSIGIRARDTVVDAARAARLEIPVGQYLEIEVADNGTGMTEEVAAHAIEPFFTTKEVGKGTGLGLSMVHGFARQSGGAMEIDTEPGKGTTVRLFLPAIAASPDQVPGKLRLQPVRQRNVAVLAVEDDPDVLATTVSMLRGLGYRAIGATNGPSALAALEHAGHIDVLFTDMIMPEGMSGPELARQARNLRPDLKVVYTSGYTENAVPADRAGNEDITLIRKPYSQDDLAAAMNRVIAQAPAEMRRPA
jgi:PAS domain S-box-containing protein